MRTPPAFFLKKKKRNGGGGGGDKIKKIFNGNVNSNVNGNFVIVEKKFDALV